MLHSEDQFRERDTAFLHQEARFWAGIQYGSTRNRCSGQGYNTAPLRSPGQGRDTDSSAPIGCPVHGSDIVLLY